MARDLTRQTFWFALFLHCFKKTHILSNPHKYLLFQNSSSPCCRAVRAFDNNGKLIDIQVFDNNIKRLTNFEFSSIIYTVFLYAIIDWYKTKLRYVNDKS